jgi:hypothetical protein
MKIYRPHLLWITLCTSSVFIAQEPVFNGHFCKMPAF